MNKRDKDHWESLQNLPAMLEESTRRFADRPSLQSVDGTAYSYGELGAAVRFVAGMLQSAGIEPGDRVAILSENSPHWVISYFSILAAGAIAVPILPDFRGSEVAAILSHAGVRWIFISGKLLHQLEADLPGGMEWICLTEDFRLQECSAGTFTLTGPDETGLTPVKPGSGMQEGPSCSCAPGDTAALIYTSGTTGMSKGVELSHLNILENARQSASIHRVVPKDRFLSVLPLAHTYECTIGMVVPLLNGASVYYIDRPPSASYLGPVLQKVAPTTMLTVPLIVEKIYRSRIRPSLYGSPAGRLLMANPLTRRILSRLAVRKLLRFFGGRLRFFGIGGAPLAPDVEKFLIEGGFPYAVGYGLTETSPLLAGFGPGRGVYRSVGKVLEGVRLRIDRPDPVTGEGEIVVKGPNVMKGYYRDEERTREVFTGDGYFRTGDLGYLDRNGTLFIRGRLKNMILGPNGENIYPEEIEAVINSREMVTESLVMHYKGKLTALVHLNIETLEEQLQHLKDNADDFQDHFRKKATEILNDLMENVNRHVARNARLQLMILQEKPFEKTPTKKIKRFLYQNPQIL